MKKISQRIICAALVCAMALPFAACGKKNGSGGGSGSGAGHSGQKIAEDAPWFDAKVLKVDLGIKTDKDVANCYSRLAGEDEKNMFILSTGRYQMPMEKEANMSMEQANEYVIAAISVVDRATNTTKKTIDLSKEFGIFDSVTGAEFKDGKLILNISKYDMKTYQVNQVEQVLNLETGKLEAPTESSSQNNQRVEKTFKAGKYTLAVIVEWKENGGVFYVQITSPDGSSEKVEVKSSGAEIYEITAILPVTETTALVTAITGGGNRFFELDMSSASIKSLDAKDYEWLDIERLRNPYSSEDGTVYYTTSLGIEKADIKNKKTETAFDYSWCSVNRSILEMLEVVEANGDSFVLCGMKFDNSSYTSGKVPDFYVIEVAKADKNPHSGKTVLNLYTPNGQTNEMTAEAILKFNETNGGYFIEVTDKYKTNNSLDFTDINSEDEYQNVMLNTNNKMSNQLAMDIMNGEGPDILMNTSGYGQLNSETYLADISSYFKDLGSDKYFTNIIEAAKVDGKLYQMPVCITIDGIQTDKKYAQSTGVGFTVKEYEAFLKGALNGQDVIHSGQAMYFAKLVSGMSDKFIKNGKVDFSAPEFKELADFVKDNVPEKSKTWDDPVYNVSNNTANYTECYGFTGYFYTMAETNFGTSILGIPSTDGRGPMFSSYTSVAVSAQAANVDACVEFIKILLSDEIQEGLALQENIVVNREAFRKGGTKAVEYWNGPAGDQLFGYDLATGKPKDNRTKFSEKNIDELEAVIQSCSKMNTEDTDITIILIEEMPAYFLGQKDIDSVIKIAQDRAQKVLNERK